MKSSHDVSAALIHDAWAAGSSCSTIIAARVAEGLQVSAPTLPPISFHAQCSRWTFMG